MGRTDARFSKYYYVRERAKRLIFEISTWEYIGKNYEKTANGLHMKNDTDSMCVILKRELKELGQQLTEVRRAMKGLCERDKYVCELRYLDGRSWEDIQVLTRLSETRVMEINRVIRKHFKEQDKLFLIEDGA